MTTPAPDQFPLPTLCRAHAIHLSALGGTLQHDAALRTELFRLTINDPRIRERSRFDPDADAVAQGAALARACAIVVELAPLCCHVGDRIYARLADRILATGCRPRG